MFHYIRIYFEPVFTILERKPKYLFDFVEICKNNPPNGDVQLMFNEYLKNPLARKVVTKPESETEVITHAELKKEEFNYMKETSFRYDALENFKNYFVDYYEDILKESNSKTIDKYLGVIRNE